VLKGDAGLFGEGQSFGSRFVDGGKGLEPGDLPPGSEEGAIIECLR
jgi:hypothetical protein